MTGINFLAQRNLAASAQRGFYLLLGTTVAAGLAVTLALSWHIDEQAARQQQLLDLLRTEHVRLDTAINAGKAQDEKIAALENRRGHLEALQQQRNEATQLLGELARRMPPHVFLTTLAQQGRNVTLSGSVPSHRHVMQLLEALRDADGAFAQIELQEARSAPNANPTPTDPGRLHDFVITAGHRAVAAR